MEKGKILIIDDDPLICDLLSGILKNIKGCTTDTAVDGLDGIEKIQKDKYDIVFTDLQMPRLSGMDFLRAAKKIEPATPVVVITGCSSIEGAINAMKEGASDFVTKPFRIDEINSIVDRLISERRLFSKITENADYDKIVKGLNLELFKRLQEISILHTISTELDKIYDNREIFERIVEMASRLLKVKEASFGIVENGNLKIKRAIGTRERTIPISGTLFEHVINKRDYYLASFGEVNPHSGPPLTSPFFSIPFIIKGEVFGILNLANKADGSEFTEDEISIALTLAKKAALRIENNALYELFYNNLINTLKSLVITIEARDSYTMQHSERVTGFALEIAEVMKIAEDEKDAIRFGGYLHDIGKISVRDTVLLKPGKLTDEEMKEIRLHPVIGYNIIEPIGSFKSERLLIRNHHENFNGRGYPDGLAGDKIPLICRILAVADTYDAMTSTRPYRKALSHKAAINELQRCSGTQFDGEVARAFLQTAAGRGRSVI